ncbi:Oidioi.mRNA.OKI2018_I69.PAR.g10341.t1.cds [Oikopleura dioica]|uniref:Zinc finger CCCH domain-containing protein 14 n=1 Tax=Oikopleura dioica TaxID=34765 RepID=A0ABN7RQ41_OIKDI|nr:Oidioi.mRNA.OKI2018_I69.PAR.g10341.t1.cds [Oikopleura dioica]
MQASAEISHKVRLAIKTKLTELGAYVDDELPDYVLVMVANRRGRADMKKELELFLGDATDRFCTWLFGVLDRLKDAKKGRELMDKKKSEKLEDKELDDFSEDEEEEKTSKSKSKPKSPTPEPKESKKSSKKRSPTPEKSVKSKKKERAASKSPARNGMPSWSPQRKKKESRSRSRSRSRSKSRSKKTKRRSRSRSDSRSRRSRSRSRDRKEKKSKDKKSKKDRRRSRSRSRSRSKKDKKSDRRKELEEEEKRSKARERAREKGVKSSIVVKREEVKERPSEGDKTEKSAKPTSNLIIRAINESSGTSKKKLSGITRSITVSKPGETKVVTRTIEKTGDKRRSKTKDEGREPIKTDSRVFVTKNGGTDKSKRASSPKFVVTLEGKKGSTAALKTKTKKKVEEENEEALVIHPDDSDDESSKLLKTSELTDEAQKIKQLQKTTLPQEMTPTPIVPTMEINAALDSSDQDKRTIFVSGLDVATTEPELKEHFQVCGTILRVTILRDRFTRVSKGCAYIQFASVEQRKTADVFDMTEIHGKTIKVTQKINRAELHSAPPATAPAPAYHKPYKPHFNSIKPGGHNPYSWTRSGYMPPR